MAVRAGLTGLFTTLLPCGWLYVFVAAAGGTGSVRAAMATMAVFWLGTLPALVAVGVGAQRVLAPFRRRLPALSATVVLIMGLLSMSGHLGGLAEDHAAHGASAVAPVTEASAHGAAATASPTDQTGRGLGAEPAAAMHDHGH
jgi:sulfite exporter TauE/SafE